MAAQTFCERLVASANTHQHKVAMVALGAERPEQITFGELLAQVRSLAYRLTQEGEQGERVALLGENHPHWALAYLGIIYRGAVAVPLDPAATTEALTNFIDDSAARLAFVSPASLDKFQSVCEGLGRQIPLVTLQPVGQRNGHASFTDQAQTPVPAAFATAPLPAKEAFELFAVQQLGQKMERAIRARARQSIPAARPAPTRLPALTPAITVGESPLRIVP